MLQQVSEKALKLSSDGFRNKCCTKMFLLDSSKMAIGPVFSLRCATAQIHSTTICAVLSQPRAFPTFQIQYGIDTYIA